MTVWLLSRLYHTLRDMRRLGILALCALSIALLLGALRGRRPAASTPLDPVPVEIGSADAAPVSPAPVNASPDDPVDIDDVDGFVARRFVGRGAPPMPYRLFVPPGYDRSKRYPLIVWLHGAGGVGNDNLRQIMGDQIPGTRLWTKPEHQSAHPMFVLVPQTSSFWFSANAKGVLPIDQVLGIIESLRAEFGIDTTRLYLSGQSLGGNGTWGMITRGPTPFAAAILVCPAGLDPKRSVAHATMPVWVFMGDRDAPPSVSGARGFVAALRAARREPRYTEYAGAGHDIWVRVFKEPALPAWLFAQHR
jgi:predicted peptidase